MNPMTTQFMGMNFVWFVGVVENRLDPAKAGRVQVRCYGLHTEKKSDLPTEDLHWAQCMLPVSSAGVSGLGEEVPGIVEGSTVIGFFLDGQNMQHPLVIGTLGGVPIQGLTNQGFSDPRNSTAGFPKVVSKRTVKQDGSGTTITSAAGPNYPAYLDEPDVNRLSRNESIDKTIINDKKQTNDSGVPIAMGGSWDEPPTPYAAKYPFNKVIQTESGHVIEVDDTPDAERIHIWHRSGTSAEMHPNGTRVDRTELDYYSIVRRSLYQHVEGSGNITVDGGLNIAVNTDGGSNKSGTKDLRIQVGTSGNVTIQVDSGNVNLIVNGNITGQANGNISFTAMKTLSLIGGEAISLQAPIIREN